MRGAKHQQNMHEKEPTKIFHFAKSEANSMSVGAPPSFEVLLFKVPHRTALSLMEGLDSLYGMFRWIFLIFCFVFCFLLSFTVFFFV